MRIRYQYTRSNAEIKPSGKLAQMALHYQPHCFLWVQCRHFNQQKPIQLYRLFRETNFIVVFSDEELTLETSSVLQTSQTKTYHINPGDLSMHKKRLLIVLTFHCQSVDFVHVLSRKLFSLSLEFRKEM